MAVNIEQVFGECMLSQFENFCTVNSIGLRFVGIKKAETFYRFRLCIVCYVINTALFQVL